MSEPEFPRPVDRRHMPASVELVASKQERSALAARFSLVAIEQLSAPLQLERIDDVVVVQGRLAANIVQSCAVSGDDLRTRIDEPLSFRFVPQPANWAEEVELSAGELDEIAYSGHTFDLGEAVAQSLALAIDPYACGPDADRVRREKNLGGEGATGPFAALIALKSKDS